NSSGPGSSPPRPSCPWPISSAPCAPAAAPPPPDPMDWLRLILFPGSGPTAGASTLTFEGIDPGWALIGWVVLAVALWWLHGRLLPSVSFGKRVSIVGLRLLDRKSTRLNSSHVKISYAVFCAEK